MAAKTTKATTRKKTPAKQVKAAAPAKDAKRPGVISTIAEILTKASEEKPITKEQILGALTKRFPERDPEKMAATINAQVPGRLSREKGIEVVSGEGGYWAS